MAPNLLPHVSHEVILTPEAQKNERSYKKEDGSISGSTYDEVDNLEQNSKNFSRSKNEIDKRSSDKLQIVWRNVIIFIILHSIFLYVLVLIITFRIRIPTLFFSYIYATFVGFGITAGAHRLWAHRSYTANLPLRIFLMLAQSAALQNDIHEWVRDHRVHHKFTDTDADPHNASRGFFFSHIGWLMCKKHRDVILRGKTMDMSDVLNDPVVKFQMRYYIPLVIVMNFMLPTFIPWYFFGEDAWVSATVSIGRYVMSLNFTWLVNSAAHIWGMKPYDRFIKPTENKFVSAVALGEGWHNYHHIFPWDYKTAELGNYKWNLTTGFLDLMAKIGWATNLKTASEEIIRKRALRTGDNSRFNTRKSDKYEDHSGELIWGWGDKDMNQDEVNAIKRMQRHKA